MEVRNMIRSHQALLSQIAEDTTALRATRVPEAPESIFSADTSGASMLNQLAPPIAVGMATQPSFEATILSSGVYKKTLARALSPTNDNDSKADSDTTVDVESFNPCVEGGYRLGKTPILASCIPQGNYRLKANDASHYNNGFSAGSLLPNQPLVETTIEDIVDISAMTGMALGDYTAQCPNELSFEYGAEIFNISPRGPIPLGHDQTRRRNVAWSGQVVTPGGLLGRRGLFDEALIFFHYPLRQEIKVVAKENMDSSDPKFLTAKKGSVIILKVNPIFPASGFSS
jgi:hypothetical protein